LRWPPIRADPAIRNEKGGPGCTREPPGSLFNLAAPAPLNHERENCVARIATRRLVDPNVGVKRSRPAFPEKDSYDRKALPPAAAARLRARPE
jgi:hypothetical protein